MPLILNIYTYRTSILYTAQCSHPFKRFHIVKSQPYLNSINLHSMHHKTKQKTGFYKFWQNKTNNKINKTNDTLTRIQEPHYRSVLILESYIICVVTMMISVRIPFRTKPIKEQHFHTSLFLPSDEHLWIMEATIVLKTFHM